MLSCLYYEYMYALQVHMHLIDRFLFDTQWAENVKKVQTNNTQSPHLCWSISYATNSYITKLQKNLEQYFCHISSVFCTIFCKFVHCDGSTRGKATRATITVNSFAKNSAKNTRNVTQIAPNFSTIQ